MVLCYSLWSINTPFLIFGYIKETLASAEDLYHSTRNIIMDTLGILDRILFFSIFHSLFRSHIQLSFIHSLLRSHTLLPRQNWRSSRLEGWTPRCRWGTNPQSWGHHTLPYSHLPGPSAPALHKGYGLDILIMRWISGHSIVLDITPNKILSFRPSLLVATHIKADSWIFRISGLYSVPDISFKISQF